MKCNFCSFLRSDDHFECSSREQCFIKAQEKICYLINFVNNRLVFGYSFNEVRCCINALTSKTEVFQMPSAIEVF